MKNGKGNILCPTSKTWVLNNIVPQKSQPRVHTAFGNICDFIEIPVILQHSSKTPHLGQVNTPELNLAMVWVFFVIRAYFMQTKKRFGNSVEEQEHIYQISTPQITRGTLYL